MTNANLDICNENNNDLIINSKNLFLVLNKKKGLAIKEFIDKKLMIKYFWNNSSNFYNLIDYDVDFFGFIRIRK